MNQNTSSNEGHEINLVEIWLRRDPVRWTAGVLAGLFSCLTMFLFVGLLSKSLGSGDFFYLVKVFALPIVGPSAMDYETLSSVLIAGSIVFLVLGSLLGAVYAHMTGTNRIAPLIGMGFTWAFFSWVFISNLYTNSFRDVFAAQIPSAGAFFAWLVFGFSLVSVSFFDKMLRGGNR